MVYMYDRCDVRLTTCIELEILTGRINKNKHFLKNEKLKQKQTVTHTLREPVRASYYFKDIKRRQFWFCCHVLSGNCQAGPYVAEPASTTVQIWTSWKLPDKSFDLSSGSKFRENVDPNVLKWKWVTPVYKLANTYCLYTRTTHCHLRRGILKGPMKMTDLKLYTSLEGLLEIWEKD